MHIRFRLLQLLPFWLNSNYELGKNDCLQMIISLYPELPKTFYNIDILNGEYKELYIEDKELALKLYREYITSNFDYVDIGREGDIVEIPFLDTESLKLNPENLQYYYTYGIYLSEKQAIIADEKDGRFRIIPLSIFEDKSFYRFRG